ncbi:PIG-L deacetylase family protein [Streptomyces xiaopingdaonensis]|uniref:PIG-L deacetylase family protein n=1 Tax=Streptomyces xiaopingdaonensis TaxID=1565415 RepID=UPI000300B392|nr:PIG-L deacetylase family protein [Streptomyces xiaopingdaonensis]
MAAEETPELEPMPDDWRRALAVVAHPDDMEYGGSAAVAEWTAAGKEVAYLLVTRGEAGIDGLEPVECAALRETEQCEAAHAVGVEEVRFLDHRDGVLEEGPGLRADITAVLRAFRPELVLTINHHDTWAPGSWNTPDHRAVGRGVLDAVGDAGNRWIFADQLESGDLQPWGGVRWVAVAGSPRPTHAAAVRERSVDRAVGSLLAHRTYLTGLGSSDPEGYARSVVHGGLVPAAERHGGSRAVAFELYSR